MSNYYIDTLNLKKNNNIKYFLDEDNKYNILNKHFIKKFYSNNEKYILNIISLGYDLILILCWAGNKVKSLYV